jgi:DNA (cytosine-5)-methyltransferase 1
MNHASLFSGIGGFDLAAEWNGWNNVFNCEWEEFPRKVLKHHFPNAKQYEDIKDFNANEYRGRVDVLSGGFPCQPFSVAGKRKGTEDDRHLWPEMLRVVGECQPRWVVGENVRGLVSWSEGLVFETCCADLENLGYSVQSFIIPACATGAPHRRDRVWIVAHNHNGNGQKERLQTRREIDVYGIEGNGNAPDTDNPRTNERVRDNRNGEKENQRREGQSLPEFRAASNQWEEFPTVPPICGGDDGLPKELDGITFPKWRKESIKAYGNAIVPQVAHRIFQSISDYESSKQIHK